MDKSFKNVKNYRYISIVDDDLMINLEKMGRVRQQIGGILIEQVRRTISKQVYQNESRLSFDWMAYVIDMVSKFKIDGIKLSLFRIDRMVFQSGMTSLSSVTSNSKQIDSNATFTTAGGFAIDRISDNCFFFIPLTATCSHGTGSFQIQK